MEYQAFLTLLRWAAVKMDPKIGHVASRIKA